MKKIMLVGPFPPSVGGVTTSLHNILSSDLRKRFEFVCFSNSRPPKTQGIGAHGYRDFFQGGLRRMVTGIAVTLRHLFAFPIRVVKESPEIIQIHTSDYFVFWENSFYILLGRLCGKKVIVRMGGVFDKFYRKSNPLVRFLIRKILALPDILIVQSEYWKNFVSRLTDPAKIRVINNFLDTDEFFCPPRSNDEYKRILFICGSEAKRKGLDVVLESIRYLSHDGIGTSKFVFVATNEHIRKRVEQLNVAPYVEFHGVLSKDEMRRMYREADIFLLPSFGEGFPNSMLEAMASGLPVIATRVGAVPEVIEDGTNGILIDPGDPGALTRALKKLLYDAELRRTFGDNNLKKVRERYHLPNGISRLETIYDELLGHPKGEREWPQH
jgi:glycosyltransferase involved in cell wall biosynthesis